MTGVDINEGMLTVAAASPAWVVWRTAPAEELPFADASFDAVLSQFALMFFADRREAVHEMARVARPEGRVTVATWAELDESPGYAAMVQLLDRLLGREAADALRAPFSVGTTPQLPDAMNAAFTEIDVVRLEGVASFDSLEAWVHTDVRGWTLADTIDDDQYESLLAAAAVELAPFVGTGGRVSFAAPALVATASQ